MAAADAVTEQYAVAMDEAIAAAATAEAQVVQLEARVAELQAAFDAVSQTSSDACGYNFFGFLAFFWRIFPPTPLRNHTALRRFTRGAKG